MRKHVRNSQWKVREHQENPSSSQAKSDKKQSQLMIVTWGEEEIWRVQHSVSWPLKSWKKIAKHINCCIAKFLCNSVPIYHEKLSITNGLWFSLLLRTQHYQSPKKKIVYGSMYVLHQSYYGHIIEGPCEIQGVILCTWSIRFKIS